MRVAFFDTHQFEKDTICIANQELLKPHDIHFYETRLVPETVAIARGFPVICVFVNDKVTGKVIRELAADGLRLIALRSAGFNNVDLPACEESGVKVVRVPAYSPHAVAEHATAILLALNRKIYRSYARVRDLNFSLEGLVGFDLYRKTVGVIGTGKIGACFVNIMAGFGCRVIAYDPFPSTSLQNVEYVPLDEVYKSSDIISLHLPLTPETRHLLDERAFSLMKRGAYLVNTSRGGLVDSRALVEALKEGRLGGAALDVYEEEEGIFFFDLSDQVLQDDVLARLLTFPNVVITSHQAFLTKEALREIAVTTMRNIADFEVGKTLLNEVRT